MIYNYSTNNSWYRIWSWVWLSILTRELWTIYAFSTSPCKPWEIKNDNIGGKSTHQENIRKNANEPTLNY